jgi:hypothetical protein
MQMMKDCETLLFVGAGYGFAEVVLAAEYPDRHFVITDVPGNSYGFTRVREWLVRGQLMNVELSGLDIMNVGRQRRVDAVFAVEVIEYVSNPRVAARNMLDLSNNATFCLAPFVVARTGTSPRMPEARVTAGFDKKSTRELFGEQAQVRWGYWADAGVILRNELAKRTPEAIKARLLDFSRLPTGTYERLLPVVRRSLRLSKHLCENRHPSGGQYWRWTWEV